jgi:hypothetical protein
MEIEQGMLRNQSSQISCLTDDLIRITRKLSSVASCAGSVRDPGLAYAFNTLLCHRLEKSVAMFGIILEMLLASIPGEYDSAPDNSATPLEPLHSVPSVDVRPAS